MPNTAMYEDRDHSWIVNRMPRRLPSTANGSAHVDSLDHAIFLVLNASAEPPRLLVGFAIVCAKYLFFIVPLHLALVWVGGTRSMRFVALSGLLAMAGALLLSGLIGALVSTPRPSVIGIGHTLLDHRPSAAFPSNHAIVCFTWATTLAIFGRRWLAGAVALIGILVAWSRIYLGLHFPIDMVGAAAISAAVAVLAARIMTRFGADLLDLCEAAQRLTFWARARPKVL